MRILLPAREAGSGGLGSTIRGLLAYLPEALPEDLELVAFGHSPPDGAWFRTDRQLARFVHEQVAVARAARKVDLVHLPDYRPLLASTTPFLLTVHDVLFLDRPDVFPPAITRYKTLMLRAALAKKPAAVVTISDYTRARLLARFPRLAPERVRVIHPGISPAHASNAPEGDGYFLTVATIEPRKNHLGLLRAFRAARRRGLDLRWKVAGAPGYLAAPIIAELQADPDVDALGWVPDDQLETLVRGARFVVYPSLAEGFGIPPLEAMARGVPVACSSGSGLVESAGQAALLVEPTDEAGWAEALLRLASDPDERERLRVLGLERAASFDWRRSAAAYVAVYEEILRAGGTGAHVG